MAKLFRREKRIKFTKSRHASKTLMSLQLVSINTIFCIGQLWKYDNTSKILKNYVGGWKYLDDQWNIPNKGESGKIEEITTTRVLGHRNRFDVNLETRKYSDHQIWIRGKTTIDGYFTLNNKASEKFLTNFGIDPLVFGNHLWNSAVEDHCLELSSTYLLEKNCT
jgi:hypothetical protein